MTQSPPKRKASSDQTLDFMKMFNVLVTQDDELRAKLPEDEFELGFDQSGRIYVNGKALGLDINKLYSALLAAR